MEKNFLARWRANFLTGLAVVLPGAVSIALVIWIFRHIAEVTDTLLFFLPRDLTRSSDGEIYWYWSLSAFALAIALICAAGVLARNYFGRKMIEWVDTVLLQVPFLNKIYGATKQVNEALTSGNKNAFKTVVMIEFPRPGAYALGFITGEGDREMRTRTQENLVCVFVPTTPNPTSGFLVLVPEEQVTQLDMSVADGLKYIISLGAIAPDFSPGSAKKVGA